MTSAWIEEPDSQPDELDRSIKNLDCVHNAVKSDDDSSSGGTDSGAEFDVATDPVVGSDREQDQVLVEQVQQGKRQAFDLLVIKYQHRLVALVKSYVKDEDLARDVAQDAFVKAYRALDKFRGDSAFYTWLYRIAINTAKNHLLAKKRRPPQQDIDVADAERYESGGLLRELSSPESQLAAEQLELALRKTMAQLPEELRVAVTLREYDGLSYEDIAQVMSCPIGTVRSRIFRARESLERCVKAIDAGEAVDFKP